MRDRNTLLGMRPILAGCMLALVLATQGCGKPAPGTITGTVKLNDKPLEGGTVIFVCDDGREVRRAAIEENGSYTIADVPAGPATIAVIGQEPLPTNFGPQMGDAPTIKDAFKKGFNDPVPAAVRKRVRVPTRYQKPESSGLTYTVLSGDQKHDIPLEKRPDD
jgi:hypothetical protein